MARIITIEGNIGAGKSTFVKFLKEECEKLEIKDLIFLQEPVDEWTKIKVNGVTILEKFYEDPEKYAFSFQMMAYISRLAILTKALNDNPNATIISERCLLTDKHVFAKMLYDSNKIDPYSFQIYNLWFDEFYNRLPLHKHIYLSSTPGLIKERINKRNRTGENKIDMDYLNKCNKYHFDFFSTNTNLLMMVNMDTIELHSDDINDPSNNNYKELITNVIDLIKNEVK